MTNNINFKGMTLEDLKAELARVNSEIEKILKEGQTNEAQ